MQLLLIFSSLDFFLIKAVSNAPLKKALQSFRKVTMHAVWKKWQTMEDLKISLLENAACG